MDFNNFLNICKELVAENRNDVQPEEVYVVWYCKTLQHAKALLSTPVSDGLYYELTYNGDKGEIYFDEYKKNVNRTIDVSDK